jgi:hypothetical protein
MDFRVLESRESGTGIKDFEILSKFLNYLIPEWDKEFTIVNLTDRIN